jgi:nitrogenase molybdenum-iron protein alpha/beta subunit
VALLGLPYEQIAREESEGASVQMAEIDGQAIKGDWLDGYSDTLATLARSLVLPPGDPVAGSAAIIGLLVHRLEGDCLADVAEVRRLVEGTGLDVRSVWLDGVSPVAQLAEAGRAELLVALPSGVRAARALAARTGARVIEVPIPLGLSQTQRMLRALGRACGAPERVEAFIGRELRRVVPTLEFALPHLFRDRRVAFSGDPHWFAGFALTCEELGMRVVHLSAPSRVQELEADLESELVAPPAVFMDCRERAVSDHMQECARRGLHLMVGTSDFLALAPHETDRIGMVELGFPSNYDHALFRRPTLGFDGWLCLVDRMGSALARARVHAGARATPLELWPNSPEFDAHLRAVAES